MEKLIKHANGQWSMDEQLIKTAIENDLEKAAKLTPEQRLHIIKKVHQKFKDNNGLSHSHPHADAHLDELHNSSDKELHYKYRSEFGKPIFKQPSDDLKKSAKNNTLHRMFKELAPHAKSVHVSNVKENKDGLTTNNDPHPDGLIGFDVTHEPGKKETVDKILQNFGHFRHSKAFGEEMSDDNSHHQYGAIQLHPEHAKNLQPSRAVSADIKPGRFKDVNQEAIGSANAFEEMKPGSGATYERKWQGSDPRHSKAQHNTDNFPGASAQSRAGQDVQQPAPYREKPTHLTTGISDKSYGKEVEKQKK